MWGVRLAESDQRRLEWVSSAVVSLLALVLGMVLIARGGLPLESAKRERSAQRGLAAPEWVEEDLQGVILCFWNAENFYDDANDPKNSELLEDWFAANPDMVRAKADALARTLLIQNGGRGPDIIALVAVESRRALEILRDSLNATLADKDHYDGLIFRESAARGDLGPAILTRLPIHDDLTRTFGSMRILEAHVDAPTPSGAPLVVLVSRWPERDGDGSEPSRREYADTLFNVAKELDAASLDIDLVLVGDFNDRPGDPPLDVSMHASPRVDDRLVQRHRDHEFTLLDVTHRLQNPSHATYLAAGRRIMTDHILAAPGLLDDKGWSIAPESARIVAINSNRILDRDPKRFGGPNFKGLRGPSDHFAVRVRFNVK